MSRFTTFRPQDLPPNFRNVTADGLANLAGLIPGEHDSKDDEEKQLLVFVQLGVLRDMPEQAADVIYSELAAKYLPGLTERFRAQTELVNAHMVLLNSVTHTPYFIRFLTTPAGADLASIQTKRIVECPESYARRQAQERVGEVCQFAATLLVLQGSNTISSDTKTAAIRQLGRWKQQHRHTFAEEAAERCLGILRLSDDFGSFENGLPSPAV